MGMLLRNAIRSIVRSVVWNVVPRLTLVRFARFLQNIARLDIDNDIESNGELIVQRCVVANAPIDRQLIVFDVGANRGDWVLPLVKWCMREKRSQFVFHCFEPVSSSISVLRERLQGINECAGVYTIRKALSDRVGTARIAVCGEGGGGSALNPDPHTSWSYEDVELTTVDLYCDSCGLGWIDLLKIDAEGHDLSVMRGAMGLIKSRRIRVIQFEYNHRWVWSRAFLFDVFEVIEGTDYCLGKVTPKGIEFYRRWDPELEKFVEGNYILCVPELVKDLPAIPWWKTQTEM